MSLIYTNEEIKAINELSKKTLASYADKAAKQAVRRSLRAQKLGYNDAGDKEFIKAEKRFTGLSQAINKLAKEETKPTYNVADALSTASNSLIEVATKFISREQQREKMLYDTSTQTKNA